jgi:hypothetical protein
MSNFIVDLGLCRKYFKLQQIGAINRHLAMEPNDVYVTASELFYGEIPQVHALYTAFVSHLKNQKIID